MKKGIILFSLSVFALMFLVASASATTDYYHPDYGYDYTDGGYTLNSGDLDDIETSDNNRYLIDDDWSSSIWSDYLKFDFDIDLPDSATITEVLVRFEWQKSCGVDNNAYLKIWDESASSWVQEALPSQSNCYTDRTDVVDVTSYIDSVDDVENIEVKFSASDGIGDQWTKHDLVEVEVTYEEEDDEEPDCSVEYLEHKYSLNQYDLDSIIYINEDGSFYVYGDAWDGESPVVNVQYNRTSPDMYMLWTDSDPVDGYFNQLQEQWRSDPNDGSFIDGWHTICCRAIDQPGNVQYPGTCEDFCIDTIDPTAPGKPVHSDEDICEDVIPEEHGYFDNDAYLDWTWEESTDLPECSGIDEYDVEVEEDCVSSGNTYYDTTEDPEYTYQGGQNGCSYRLRARAVDLATNEGPWSEWSEWVKNDWTNPTINFVPDMPDYPDNWYKDDFGVLVEMDDEFSGLCICSYKIYDNQVESRSGSFDCFCNMDWDETVTITVGPGEDCETIGPNMCELYVEVEDKSGNFYDDNIHFSIDYEPPVTTKIIGEPEYGEGTYVTTETEFSFDCDDGQGVGCDTTYYRTYLCGETPSELWMVYSESFTFEEESCHMIEFFSVDLLDNEEQHQSQMHYVEDTPPVTTKTYGEPHFWGWAYMEPFQLDAWITYISSDTPIILDAVDPEPHPSGLKDRWWTILIPSEEGTHIEWYGEDTHEWYLTYEDCDEWNEVCHETEWVLKHNYIEQYCHTPLREKHGLLWCEYDEPFFIDQYSFHKICYFSEDNLENQEDFHCQVVAVDNEPPQIRILNPDGPVGCAMLTFDIVAKVWDVEPHPSGIDEVKTMIVRLPFRPMGEITEETIQGAEVLCDWEDMEYLGDDMWRYTHTNLIDAGWYVVVVKAKDNLGNWNLRFKLVDFYKDVYFETNPESCTLDWQDGGNCEFDYKVTLCHGGDEVAMAMHKLCCLTYMDPELSNGETTVPVSELWKLGWFWYGGAQAFGTWRFFPDWCDNQVMPQWNYIPLENFNSETRTGYVTLDFSVPELQSAGMCDKVYYAVRAGDGCMLYGDNMDPTGEMELECWIPPCMSTPRVSYFDVDWQSGHQVVFEPHSPTYSECGNGIIDSDEECDGENLGEATCTELFGVGWSGTLSCTDSCTFDTLGCSYTSGGSSGGTSGGGGSGGGGGGSGVLASSGGPGGVLTGPGGSGLEDTEEETEEETTSGPGITGAVIGGDGEPSVLIGALITAVIIGLGLTITLAIKKYKF